jgi:hypothetical protein
VLNLARAGLVPVITVTEPCPGAASAEGRRRLLDLHAALGVAKPRLKVLPLFRIGAEAARSGAYAGWQRLQDDVATAGGFEHLPCSSCRMVTDLGVWVCPILVNEPGGRMGECLADTLDSFALTHAACWTCHVRGATCRT